MKQTVSQLRDECNHLRNALIQVMQRCTGGDGTDPPILAILSTGTVRAIPLALRREGRGTARR